MLTVTEARNLKPRAKPYKVADGRGLHLLVHPNGSKYWRLKYRHAGKERVLAFGVFPEVSITEARQRCDDARTAFRNGIDPGAQRAEAKAEQKAEAQHKVDNTFKAVSETWLTMKSPGWSKSHVDKMTLVLRDYLNPDIGDIGVGDLTSADVLRVLRKMGATVPDLGVKAAGAARSIVRYAISEGLRDEGRLLDLNLRDNLPKRVKGHLPAATTPADVVAVLDTIKALESPVTRAALLVCCYTAQRPGNVAAMRWHDVDLGRAEWTIPAAVMKMRTSHVVPLSKQAVALIETMRGRDKTYVFPPVSEQKTPHLSRDALSKALRDAGLRGKQTPHGLRATLRTVARERLGVSADVLEAQIAHAKRGDVQAAYDRTGFVDERHHAMQRWADYLDSGCVTPKRMP